MSAPVQTALLAAAFVVLWNSGFIGAEYGLPFTGPLTLLFWRYLALAALLGLYLAARGRLYWPGVRGAGHAALVGVLAHGVWLGCVFIALEREVPAALVALVVALQPLATGALSGAVTGERTAWPQWLGLLIGFAGVAIAVGARFELDADASLVGLLAPFGSVVAITIATLLERRSALRYPQAHLAVDTTLLYQSLGTAIAVTVPAWWLEGFATEWNTTFVVTMGWLIVAVSLGAYGLMWQLLKLTDATRVASLFYLGPPVTALMAYAAFGDRLTTAEWIGMAVVAVGVAVVQFGKSEGRPARTLD